MAVMHIQEKNVKTAGQNYTVPADVLRTHSMQAVLLKEFMSRDVSFSENVWNVRL